MGLLCPGAGAASGVLLLWEHPCCPLLQQDPRAAPGAVLLWEHSCGSLLQAGFWGRESPGKTRSWQWGKGETWPWPQPLWPPACGSNLQAAGSFRSLPPARSQGPVAVLDDGSSLAQDAAPQPSPPRRPLGGLAARSCSCPLPGTPARESQARLVAAGGGAGCLGGMLELSSTQSPFSPAVEPPPCVNSPSPAPQ